MSQELLPLKFINILKQEFQEDPEGLGYMQPADSVMRFKNMQDMTLCRSISNKLNLPRIATVESWQSINDLNSFFNYIRDDVPNTNIIT